MKFLMTFHGNPAEQPTPEKMAEIGKFGEEMTKAGVLLMTGGLIRPSNGTKVVYAGGKYTWTDGPFPETKELIDGFALIKTNTKEEALAVAKRFMAISGPGEGEILQVFDQAELACC
jgi:hypothetical protein